MYLLFAFTLFGSAFLLFVIQPLVARLVLPILGGSPSVWNTCMVFFQSLLLAGYAYAHAAPARIGVKRHAVVHAVLLFLPLVALPIALPGDWSPPVRGTPIGSLLVVLLVTAGLPFFAMATTAPLLQRWFATLDRVAASDPYFLYAASNLGSMLALLSYPFLIEPTFSLGRQSRLWAIGYGIEILLIILCAIAVWRAGRGTTSGVPVESLPAASLAWRRRIHWVLLAMVPSSLMLSVTTYITTDLAAIPLFWVLPLAVYLLSYILVFARRRWPPQRALVRWLPLVVLVLGMVYLSEAGEPVVVLIALHLIGLAWVATTCHGALAEDRPHVAHLTEFYIWLALGGVLGGIFNALLAPVLFNTIVEYPLGLVLACLLMQGSSRRSTNEGGVRRADFAWALAIGVGTAALILLLQHNGMQPGPMSLAAMFAGPLLICYLFHAKPVRFALSLGGVFLAGSLYSGVHGKTESTWRSFFGVHRVTVDPTGAFRQIVHGNTIHGRQRLNETGPPTPLTYYHPSGPMGRLLYHLDGDPRLEDVGLIGLGVGSLAHYAKPGQTWTFFEIDPAVYHIAVESGLFRFMTDPPAWIERGEERITVSEGDRENTRHLIVILGDGRRSLVRSEEKFGLLVVDAFASDAIPLHLLTREALQVYTSRMTEEGILAFHVSNRYLDLKPILANLAASMDPPLVCFARSDLNVSKEEQAEGKLPSEWVIMSRDRSAVDRVVRHGLWEPLRGDPGARVWTDDHANLLEAFRRPAFLSGNQE